MGLHTIGFGMESKEHCSSKDPDSFSLTRSRHRRHKHQAKLHVVITTLSIMRLSIATIALTLTAASAFTTSPVAFRRFAPLSMSTKVEHDVPITITGTNIDLTPALEEYVNTKLERPLSKISGIKETECEVFLNVNKNPKVCCLLLMSRNSTCVAFPLLITFVRLL